jgi:hypothetical protein
MITHRQKTARLNKAYADYLKTPGIDERPALELVAYIAKEVGVPKEEAQMWVVRKWAGPPF